MISYISPEKGRIFGVKVGLKGLSSHAVIDWRCHTGNPKP